MELPFGLQMLILIPILLGVAFVFYVAWFDYEKLIKFNIWSNRHNPFFKHYERIYTSPMNELVTKLLALLGLLIAIAVTIAKIIEFS